MKKEKSLAIYLSQLLTREKCDIQTNVYVCVSHELSRIFIRNLQFLLIIRLFAKSYFIYGDFSLNFVLYFFPSSLSLSFGLGSVYLWSVFVHLVMLALNLFIHSLSSSVCSVTHIRNSTQLLQLLLLAHLAPYNWSLVSAISFI